MFTCPKCGAERTRYEYYATGDWSAEFRCGTFADDNGLVVQSDRCRRAQIDQKIPPVDEE